MNIILFDEKDNWTDLLPISFTRPIADIRIGILTIAEKWQHLLPEARISYKPADYLTVKFATEETGDDIIILSNILPDADLAARIAALQHGEALIAAGKMIALRGTLQQFEASQRSADITVDDVDSIVWLYDIFLKNDAQLRADFEIITRGRTSASIDDSCTVIGRRDQIFIEEGATVQGATLNTLGGPIYIGKDATIMEGSCIRAPFAACTHAQVNMAAKIYGATTLGPHCKVGGELNNVVMIGYSNKAHDGFLGNAVVGEWCNIGAGTNASNLKNDYTEIKLWNYRTHRFLKTGLQFCGLILGDHSKIGINCMLNTATVIGVGVNIHGAGFPRAFVASFLEGGSAGYTDVSVAKFFDIAKRMMARRGITLSDSDKEIFESIYAIADNYK
ncbi:MAG: putative sugar nucleotidyl transferase [Candidatus Limisoma sp.]|nr:putative sugar nucleotidyl transferase [Bacteroidales bacterium]MDY5894410.1 putative sugar nucleotidyl transferase [Candidatus Limisoma sp.]MDY5999090.1 putative sugar nucleotidyl transferase [Candidatus Limisoma sp.]